LFPAVFISETVTAAQWLGRGQTRPGGQTFVECALPAHSATRRETQ
jgi:hypothetical protein